MEIKKSSRADLERGWGLRFVLALVVVLSVVYVAFQWKTANTEDKNMEQSVLSPNLLEADLPPVWLEEPEQPVPEMSQTEVASTDMDQVEVVEEHPQDPLKETVQDLRREIVQLDKDENELIDFPVEKTTEKELLPDSLPHFPGGDGACMRFLTKHVRYPAVAIQGKVRGCVYVEFIVEADGELTGFRIQKGVSPSLDREALRVVKLMPRWKPGRQNGVPSRFLYVLPVDFRFR